MNKRIYLGRCFFYFNSKLFGEEHFGYNFPIIFLLGVVIQNLIGIYMYGSSGKVELNNYGLHNLFVFSQLQNNHASGFKPSANTRERNKPVWALPANNNYI
jgi:hypothetical protein